MNLRFMILTVVIIILSTALTGTARSEQSISGGKEMAATATDVGAPSLADIRAMYVAELQARDRFRAYAQQADDEGYGQVASMFRAIARGEEVHATNLAALLSSSDATFAGGEQINPLSTEENLRTALAEQRYERDVLYPQVLKQVRKEKNKHAEKALDRNRAAEPLHFAWYTQALSDLDAYKGNNIDFLVCTGCGNTVRSLHDKKCSVCGTPKEQFESVR